MEDGLDAELSLLRARVRDRVERSDKLVARVRESTRDTQERSRLRFVRAEEQLNTIVSRLFPFLGSPPGDDPGAGVLQAVLDATDRLYGGCASMSVTSATRPPNAGDTAETSPDRLRYRTLASRGAAAPLDAAQYVLEEGPCVDAVEMDQLAVLFAPDFADDDSRRCWPRFSEVAQMLGVRSAVSVAVPWTDVWEGFAVGSINLYSSTPHAFPQPETHGLILGAWAGALLARAYAPPVREEPREA